MPDLVIDDISNIFRPIEVTNTRFGGTKLWWHGMADIAWDLKPSIFHQNLKEEEHNLSVKFMSRAKARHRNCPDGSSYDDWLFLMQHFGLPTRLLDWSESILISAFFAVEDENFSSKDGVVYGLQPSQLNVLEIGAQGMPLSGEESLKDLFREAMLRPSYKKDQRIVAVMSDQIEMRHLIQSAAFTVHGREEKLNQQKYFEKCLVKVLIPANKKRLLRAQLDNLGITRSYLFPDLTNLALGLRQENWIRKM